MATMRLTTLEKASFQEAADLAEIPLSAWMRERLRLAVIRELENAGRSVPFIQPLRIGEASNVRQN
jgi:hypothetical protein